MSDARNAKVVSAKSFGAIFLRQPLTRLTQYLQHTVHKYYSMVLLSIAEYLRRFPRARAHLLLQKREIIFCDRIITALTFERIAQNRTVVVRALYTNNIYFAYRWVYIGACINT